MTDQEYEVTQHMLIVAGHTVKTLDLNAFRDRIAKAQAVGPVLDPTLWIKANQRLDLINELAGAAIRMKTAMHNLDNHLIQLATQATQEKEP